MSHMFNTITIFMDERYTIRCMRHCDNSFNIFYIKFPRVCSICKKKIEGSVLLPPFCIPQPFVSSRQARCSVILKPTDGSFLTTYLSGDNLHIGLTTSLGGLVYSFYEDGVQVEDNSIWSICIVVNVLDITQQKFFMFNLNAWDDALTKHCTHTLWSYDKYNATENNCYDFVLGFLQTIVPSSQEFFNKDTFCERYVLPETKKAAHYIDLYRNIVGNGGATVRKILV
ncbi:MKRN2 opposite strand protein-like isoform X2 [Xenia sp. Carnegie-2017]|uniref:MKRN2 opposite strand protein-like isoform X2 n=1 Tax=Xenia sp. Carnegie-2017 TaxID=2897299 RepID=UPI001F0384A8|nr:MKRN2 opposite strand protein-like isoform X2 [Xenia sp. Carnegie-2017]